ncbi:MAG: DNA topoisomerase IB [Burkholderiaceae bacterium]
MASARTAPTPPSEHARAGSALVYVDDAGPGIRRRKCGKGFSYRTPDGAVLRDAQHLRRIAALAIPPAYADVWICSLPHGHLQATGRDSRGRKQYRYHAEWRRARDADKYARLAEFGLALPRIRRRVAADLRCAGSGTGRSAVLAALVRLLDTTLVRVGNEEYARSNGSFGLTTLRNRHAAVRGARLRLSFQGKSGVPHEIDLEDPLVARVVRRCQELPGQELFRYADDAGELHGVSSTEVNNYLREASGSELTAKDFRTWHGSVLALSLMRSDPEITPVEVVRSVATTLRNTAAVCRKSYVHPHVLESARPILNCLTPKRRLGLTPDECALIDLLADKARASARRARSRELQ